MVTVMDATHIHLLLNHFPVVGTLIGGAIFIVGVFRREALLQLTGLVTLVVVSLVAVPVFLTGEGAEEAVEHLPGVSEAIIHEHEEWAEAAIWAIGAMGLVSAASFAAVWRRLRFAKYSALAVMLLVVTSFALVAKTANVGGQIRHTEIRPGAADASQSAEAGAQKRRAGTEHR
jgi:uncharacterized membrane protein